MRLRGLLEHAEMGAYVLGFRLLSFSRPIGSLVRLASELSDVLPASRSDRSVVETIRIAQGAARRTSKLVPGARCLHRALSSRLWLARRRIASEIVVGFRKGEGLEGHAWLEVETPTGPLAIFEQEGYRESFREGAVLEQPAA